MLLLLLGLLLGLVLRDVVHTLLAHSLDLVLVLKTDLLAIKDKLLSLLGIKVKDIPPTPPSAPAV